MAGTSLVESNSWISVVSAAVVVSKQMKVEVLAVACPATGGRLQTTAADC